MRYRDFAIHCRGLVARHGMTLTRPDDDWPVGIVFDHRDRTRPVALGLAPHLDGGRVDMGRLAHAIAHVAKLTRATKVAVIASAWLATLKLDDADRERLVETGELPDDLVAPSRDPDRREVVMVAVVDAERVEAHTAEIQRSTNEPPTLRAWTVGPPTVFGRAIDPIVHALR